MDVFLCSKIYNDDQYGKIIGCQIKIKLACLQDK